MENHSRENYHREAAGSGPPPHDGPGYYAPQRAKGGSSYYPDNRDRDRRQDRDRDRNYHRDRNYASSRDHNSTRYDSYRGNGYSRDDDRDRDRDGGRALPPPPSFLPPPPSNPSAAPPRLDSYDSYRPPVTFNVPKASFDFRVNAPAAVQQALDNQAEQGGQNGKASRRNGASQRAPKRNDKFRGTDKGRAPFRPRPPYRPFVAAERELLSGAHTNLPAEDLYDHGAGVTYRNPSDISDDEEADMDISNDSNSGSDSDAREPQQKRARSKIVESATDADVPKWSNPDPYTALPPEAAAQRAKTKDVVQLIRKARVQPKEVKTSLPSQAEDFISLDIDSDEFSDDESTSGIQDVNKTVGNLSKAITAQRGQPLANHAPKTEPKSMDDDTPIITRYGPAVVPGPFPSQPLLEKSDALGSRKRTHDDRIKGPFQPKKAPGGPPRGAITSDWSSVPGTHPTPWLRFNSWKPDVMRLLHQEIVDFYNYVRPRAFEDEIRTGLVRDFNAWVRHKFRDAKVYPFGSYASGLYLPTGDMDLAFLSNGFKNGGNSKYHTKSTLYKLRSFLQNDRKAYQNDIECIVHAKVPIVKYVDARTALKVDISFENTSGIVAIETFNQWKDEYPAMPVLVTLIKQFLAMRGLNEPVNGGIGGFSVICLAVSLFQLEPSFQTKSLDTKHALGEVLMRFFEFYGKIFNYKDVAISVKPPKLVKKNEYAGFGYKNYDRLSIIDPNNPANDIAGGSSNFPVISQVFSKAHDDLAERMCMLYDCPDAEDQSILGVILGGNYSSFESQRNHLRELSERLRR